CSRDVREFSLPSFILKPLSLRRLNSRAPRKLVANKQCFSRDEQDVLVSKLAIDVTELSRPGVAALRYSHSSQNPKTECIRNLFVKGSDFLFNKLSYEINSVTT